MRKTSVLWLTVLAVLLTASVALASPTGSFTVYPSGKALNIDGSLDDWNADSYSQPTFILSPSVSYVRDGKIEPNDHNARVYIAYDDTYVYVGADVVDYDIQGVGTGGNIWTNTGVELWLNGGDINAPTAVAGAGSYEATDFQIDLSVMSGGQDTPAFWCFSNGVDGNAKVKLAVKKTAYGYVLEAALPKADFAGLDAVKKGGAYAMAISTVSYANGGWSGLFSPGPQWEYAKLTIK